MIQNEFTKEEEERYSKWKPSLLQKIVFLFWPNMDYVKWKEYKRSEEDK